MAKKKEVVPNKVRKDDNKKYIIQADSTTEEDITLLFKNDNDAAKAKKIDKLGVEDLPTAGAGVSNIQWVNNFWIKNDRDGYVNDVTYYIQLNGKASKIFVYYNGTTVVRPPDSAITSLPNGMIQVEITGGDPGTGWGNT